MRDPEPAPTAVRADARAADPLAAVLAAADGTPVAAEPAGERLFAGPGEMRARCRALDWPATPLGPVEGWPQSLRTAVALCLASGFPMLVMWGPNSCRSTTTRSARSSKPSTRPASASAHATAGPSCGT